jgi:DNA invertase Pin-like site-specific DNA recombinase
MKVIAYTRLSKGERGALGLEAQRALIEHECEQRRWQPEVRVEIQSAARAANRAVLQGCLRELERGDALVVAKLDRLARSVGDFCELAKRAEREGWALVVLDPALDMTTPMGMAFAQMLAVFAELERKIIGQRISAALKVKIDSGWRPHRCPPTIPIEVRRRIVQMHLAGVSQRKIAETLNATGVQAQGSRWHRGTVIRVLAQEDQGA